MFSLRGVRVCVFLQSSSSSSSFFPSCARSGAWLSWAFEAIVCCCVVYLNQPNKTKAGAPRLLEAFPPLGHSAVPFVAWIDQQAPTALRPPLPANPEIVYFKAQIFQERFPSPPRNQAVCAKGEQHRNGQGLVLATRDDEEDGD